RRRQRTGARRRGRRRPARDRTGICGIGSLGSRALARGLPSLRRVVCVRQSQRMNGASTFDRSRTRRSSMRHFADHLGCWLCGLTVLACLVNPARALAQSAPPETLTINDAIQFALKNYPAIRERRARAQAAEETIGVARTAYLPRLDMVWQENRATTNNVFGLLLPQSIIPPISGPVLGTKSYDSVWGSAAGVLLSWEAIDFGQRKASIDVARAQSSVARAQTALTELDVASAAADAFLTVLAADEAVRAARANVDRLQVFANAVRTLTQN